MRITWEAQSGSNANKSDGMKRPSGYDLQICSDELFENPDTARLFESLPLENTSFALRAHDRPQNARDPLCDSMVYARVRSILVDKDNFKTASIWSVISEKWLTTGANDCFRYDQYLNCSLDDDPLQWRCGTWYNGSIYFCPRTFERFIRSSTTHTIKLFLHSSKFILAFVFVSFFFLSPFFSHSS
jgi:hypothetical protein